MKRVVKFQSSDSHRSVRVCLEYQADASGYGLAEKEEDFLKFTDLIFQALTQKFYAHKIKVKP